MSSGLPCHPALPVQEAHASTLSVRQCRSSPFQPVRYSLRRHVPPQQCIVSAYLDLRHVQKYPQRRFAMRRSRPLQTFLILLHPRDIDDTIGAPSIELEITVRDRPMEKVSNSSGGSTAKLFVPWYLIYLKMPFRGSLCISLPIQMLSPPTSSIPVPSRDRRVNRSFLCGAIHGCFCRRAGFVKR